MIPEGEYEGFGYRYRRQPFARLLHDLMQSGQWQRFAITGCVQSGKTLNGLVIPVLYHVFELKESVIYGVPTMDVAADKWRKELLPVIQRVPEFRRLLPTKGKGSRGGGKFEAIQFAHGPEIRFMSGRGGDEARSGYTARVVAATEVDKFDTASETSRESDPITQLEARTDSHAERATMILECTVSIEEGRIWQEIKNGSNTRIACPCPRCKEFVTPEREHLRGWQDAEDEISAGEMAYWICPACGGRLNDQQRRAMNDKALAVHRGQEVIRRPRRKPEIAGDPPPTRTLGFRWSAFNNLFWSTAWIGSKEWRATRSEQEDSTEKEACQFRWAVPWVPPDVSVVRLEESAITQRRAHVRHGVTPAWADWVTCGIDIGKRVLHYVVCCWRESLADVPDDDVAAGILDYGTVEIDQHLPEERGIEEALLRFCGQKLTDVGYAIEGKTAIRYPDVVIIDAGYKNRVVRAVCRALDPGRFYPAFGRGAGQHHLKKYMEPTSRGNRIIHVGTNYHLKRLKITPQNEFEFDADYWKSWATRCIAKTSGPGSLVLYEADPKQHRTFIRHLMAEEETEVYDQKKNRIVTKWERKRRQNHYFDAFTMASFAADFCGVTMVAKEAEERETEREAMQTLVGAAQKRRMQPNQEEADDSPPTFWRMRRREDD